MASAAVAVSVIPALAALTATPRTSRARAGATEAERMSYRPPARASVDSPNSTAIRRTPARNRSMRASGRSSIVATRAICVSKSAKTFTPATSGVAIAAETATRRAPTLRTELPNRLSRRSAPFRPPARRSRSVSST